MTGLAFQKYEGLGNDFVIVEAANGDAISKDFARAICDRNLGVGGDGVLVVLPPISPEASARMRVINADGSIPEMCGNGLRCVALYVFRAHQAKKSNKANEEGEIVFDTDAGLRRCTVDDREGRGLVTIDMGVMQVLGDITVGIAGDLWDLSLADAGNPHAITMRQAHIDAINAVGPQISTHPRFPNGTNVEFASFHQGAVDLVVWERGCGVTRACGTGACATVAVGVKKGLLPRNEEVTVFLPGGSLWVTLNDSNHAIMRGPARHVFSGVLLVDQSAR
jgi:diaminopimelate epimerase